MMSPKVKIFLVTDKGIDTMKATIWRFSWRKNKGKNVQRIKVIIKYNREQNVIYYSEVLGMVAGDNRGEMKSLWKQKLRVDLAEE